MAQGTLLLFNEFSASMSNDMDLAADTFSARLINDTLVAAITDTTPIFADYTEVATGNGYTTGGIVVACTYSEVTGTATFAVTPGTTTWFQNGSGPTDIEQMILVNDTTAGDICVGFMDMTTDGGTTPISLANGDIVVTWASGIFTLT